MTINTDKLVTLPKLRELLFEEGCRPTIRTFYRWQRRRMIPCIKIGACTFYDPQSVRETLLKKNLIRAR
jgi:hypothetical protein